MTTTAAPTLTLFASSGVETRLQQVQRARRRLAALGYRVTVDESVRYRHQRFAGDDEQRMQTLHRVADSRPDVAMACRGGYGMTRLLDRLDWARIAASVDAGTQWMGYSDMTAFSLALWAHTGRSTWHGPMATEDFGRAPGADAQRDEQQAITQESAIQALGGELEAIGFRTTPGLDGLSVNGPLWGGNLTVLCSLLGTPHWPQVRAGILFLEDVGEHPYRVERQLLQLAQAGVLDAQAAVVVGQFTDWKPSPLDRGYRLETVWSRLRAATSVPWLTGLPVGHVPLNLPVPVGRVITLQVERRTAYLVWD